MGSIAASGFAGTLIRFRQDASIVSDYTFQVTACNQRDNVGRNLLYRMGFPAIPVKFMHALQFGG